VLLKLLHEHLHGLFELGIVALPDQLGILPDLDVGRDAVSSASAASRILLSSFS